MFPILWKFGPIGIYSYGVMLVVAYAVVSWLAGRHADRFGFKSAVVSDAVFWALVWGVIGSRAAYVVVHPSQYSNVLDVIRIDQGGLIYFGGLVSALVSVVWIGRAHGYRTRPWLDFLVGYLPLGQAIGRVGCLLNGCCGGRVTDSHWGLFVGGPLATYPTQIYAIGADLLIFAFLMRWRSRKQFDGQILAAYLILISLKRFVLEFWRADGEIKTVGDILSTMQAVSIGIAVAGVALYFFFKGTRSKEQGI